MLFSRKQPKSEPKQSVGVLPSSTSSKGGNKKSSSTDGGGGNDEKRNLITGSDALGFRRDDMEVRLGDLRLHGVV